MTKRTFCSYPNFVTHIWEWKEGHIIHWLHFIDNLERHTDNLTMEWNHKTGSTPAMPSTSGRTAEIWKNPTKSNIYMGIHSESGSHASLKSDVFPFPHIHRVFQKEVYNFSGSQRITEVVQKPGKCHTIMEHIKFWACNLITESHHWRALYVTPEMVWLLNHTISEWRFQRPRESMLCVLVWRNKVCNTSSDKFAHATWQRTSK